jgi:hypothetical protein
LVGRDSEIVVRLYIAVVALVALYMLVALQFRLPGLRIIGRISGAALALT